MTPNNNADNTTTNSKVQAILAPGDWVIGANTNNKYVTGAYTLSSATRAQALSGCTDAVYLMRGVTISDNIAATDCADTTVNGVFYADQAAIIAFDNTVLTIWERSTAINPSLTLYEIDSTGTAVQVASNDDSAATTTTAFIQYAVTTPAIFIIIPSTHDSVATGAYTLQISSSYTASAPVLSSPALRLRSVPTFLQQRRWRPLKAAARAIVAR
jgi:hypothetical protein